MICPEFTDRSAMEVNIMKKSIKNPLAASLAAVVLMTGTAFSQTAPEKIPVSAETGVMKYEFEEGSTSGGKIHTEGWKGNTKEDGSGEEMDLTSFSGSGFSYLDQKGTTVSVEVDVPEAGLYEMNICYCEPYDTNKKVQYLQVNGVNQGELSFIHNLKFEETSGGVVNLKKGKNTIELKGYWGYTFFDYLTLTPADEKLSNLSPVRTLSNPNASDSAKRLYSYLCDQYGKHIIAGQQEYCGEHNYNLWSDPNTFIKDNEAEFEYILDKTGKQPAIRGIDLLAYRANTNWTDHAPERAIEWVNKYKGIATLTWHWNVPSTEDGGDDVAFYVESTGNTPFTTFSITNALEEGTWENKQLLADIDAIATELTKLKEADVPVLWRPLHEAEGGWFWWGAEGPEPCKKLYRLLYDKLTNEYGLDNLIWIWTGYAYPTSADWYPGDDVVDIIGYDKYNAVDGLPNLSSIASTFYSLVQSTDGQKMVAMSENDSIPSLENLINDKAGWLYFCPWYMNYLTSEQNNPVDSLVEIYNSDYCITLDELPDLKSYPISGSDDPIVPPPDIKKTVPGDADCDRKVKLNDAVLIMQSIGNPDAYGVSGSDKSHITKQGYINADVTGDGDGLTNLDALEVQKYLLNLVSELK